MMTALHKAPLQMCALVVHLSITSNPKSSTLFDNESKREGGEPCTGIPCLQQRALVLRKGIGEPLLSYTVRAHP